MKTIAKNVRIPNDLVLRLDIEAKKSGKTRSAELVALLEEAIIELKYTAGFSLSDLGIFSEADLDSLTGGGAQQVRLPHTLAEVIANDIPTLGSKTSQPSETFSDKVRYLLLFGLAARGAVIAVELGSLTGYVYQDEEIEEKFKGLKAGSDPEINHLLKMGEEFSDLMRQTDGHILLYGEPDTGKSFCAGYYKFKCRNLCHYADLLPHRLCSATPKDVKVVWANEKAYPDQQTLVIDDAGLLDIEYLNLFLRKANLKNSRVILVFGNERETIDFKLEGLSHVLVFQRDQTGVRGWSAKQNKNKV